MIGAFLLISGLICLSFINTVSTFLFYLLDNVMWVISKCQIFIASIDIPNFFKTNDVIQVDFIKSNKSYDYLKITLNNTDAAHKQITKISSFYIEDTFNENTISSEKNYSIVENIISNYIPKDFDYYVISTNYNIHCRVETVWKGLDNLFVDSEQVDFMHTPVLMEMTYPSIEPIQFQLTTKQYNYFVVGNVLNKAFFQYFFNKYYSSKVLNHPLDTYHLLVLDSCCKRHIYTEKDEFTIRKTQDEDRVKYHIFE